MTPIGDEEESKNQKKMMKLIKHNLYDANFKELLKGNAYTCRLKTMNAKPSLLQQNTSHFASIL
jgi:hypothetical protein